MLTSLAERVITFPSPTLPRRLPLASNEKRYSWPSTVQINAEEEPMPPAENFTLVGFNPAVAKCFVTNPVMIACETSGSIAPGPVIKTLGAGPFLVKYQPRIPARPPAANNTAATRAIFFLRLPPLGCISPTSQ